MTSMSYLANQNAIPGCSRSTPRSTKTRSMTMQEANTFTQLECSTPRSMKTRSMNIQQSNTYTHLDISFANLPDSQLTFLLRLFLAHNLGDDNSDESAGESMKHLEPNQTNLEDDSLHNWVHKHLQISFDDLAHLFRSTYTRLRHLNLLGNDLSGKDPLLLTEIVSRLRSVNLSWTNLTTDQSIAVLKGVKISGLKVLYIAGVDLSEVDKILLAEALSRLRSVDLTASNLSTEQVTVLVNKCAETGFWMDLNLNEVDLSGLTEEVLKKATDLCNIND